MPTALREGIRSAVALLAAAAAFSAVAAAATPDPSIVADSPALRAVVVFLLVLPFGTVLLFRDDGLVDRSIEASMERPLVSAVYGVGTHFVVFFATGVFSTQLSSAGLGRNVLVAGTTVVLGGVLLALGGLGLTVVGTWLTDLRGERRPWQGFVVAAAVGAAAWLVPPLLVGLAVWILLVSVGIGGPAREWIHDERTPASETNA
ncbi:MAG: hypothetical protein ABEH56_04635 [Salinirussus sp.]